MPDQEWPVVFSYTRTQALEDGTLIDASSAARALGFKLPVAVGDNLFNRYVIPPAGLEGEGQSLEGRLHDLLVLAMVAARKGLNQDRVLFDVQFVMRPGRREKVRCVIHVGPGDQGEPVITVCLPEDL